MLTPERRLQLLEEIWARRDAQIAAGLPQDSLQPEEDAAMEEEGEEEEPEPEEGDAAIEEEEPEEVVEAHPASAGFDMANAIMDFEVWPRQRMRRRAEIDELFAELESDEETDVRPAANDHEAGGSGTNFINISDKEAE